MRKPLERELGGHLSIGALGEPLEVRDSQFGIPGLKEHPPIGRGNQQRVEDPFPRLVAQQRIQHAPQFDPDHSGPAALYRCVVAAHPHQAGFGLNQLQRERLVVAIPVGADYFGGAKEGNEVSGAFAYLGGPVPSGARSKSRDDRS